MVSRLEIDLLGAIAPDADLGCGHQYSKHIICQQQFIILPVLPFITNYTGDKDVVVIEDYFTNH